MKTPMPLPADVRLMNMATALLLVAFVLLTLGGWAWWLIRHPGFALQTITVQGEVSRNNAFAFRTQVLPTLEGTFFTIALAKTQQAFEAVPWVRVAVASMYLALSPRFQALDMEIDLLELTPRGSWRVQTKQGAQIELGRGNSTEIVQRLDVFLTTLKQVTARYGRGASAVASADLRHKDAYALRLHGVSTVDAANNKKP